MSPSQKLSRDAEDCHYDGKPEDRKDWHINKGIDVGNLLVALGIVAGLLGFMLSQEKRITTVETGLLYEHNVNLSQDVNKIRAEDVTSDRLQRIEDKIDKLMVRK